MSGGGGGELGSWEMGRFVCVCVRGPRVCTLQHRSYNP